MKIHVQDALLGLATNAKEHSCRARQVVQLATTADDEKI